MDWSKLVPSWSELGELWGKLWPILAALLSYRKGGDDVQAKIEAEQTSNDSAALKRAMEAGADIRGKSHADKLQYLRDNNLL